MKPNFLAPLYTPVEDSPFKLGKTEIIKAAVKKIGNFVGNCTNTLFVFSIVPKIRYRKTRINTSKSAISQTELQNLFYRPQIGRIDRKNASLNPPMLKRSASSKIMQCWRDISILSREIFKQLEQERMTGFQDDLIVKSTVVDRNRNSYPGLADLSSVQKLEQ